LVQGAAGMLMYKAEHLDELIGVCKENNVITIADEVMTGFGRTGTFFASDALKHQPDIICLSKGLTGGYMPLGVTSCAGFIYDRFISDDRSKTFFHGHSYTANPTACSAALASLDLMEREETLHSIGRIHSQHKKFASELQGHNKIRSLRLKGTILAIELNTEEETHYLNGVAEDISAFFLDKNILLRPLGNVFYILPPYCISDQDLFYIYKVITDYLNK
ncbi:MAG: aminotransferase class III-fold pyridoxal phosphate-dependent enzyme, partial [Bacteroidia bacterium]